MGSVAQRGGGLMAREGNRGVAAAERSLAPPPCRQHVYALTRRRLSAERALRRRRCLLTVGQLRVEGVREGESQRRGR